MSIFVACPALVEFGAIVRLIGSGRIEPLREERPSERLKGDVMATKIFVNLPVKDLQKSIEFFTTLGFTFNPQFTDATATCMVVSEDIFVMLLTEAKFKTFTPKAIVMRRRTRKYSSVYREKAGSMWMQWCAMPLALVGRPTINRKITGSCMRTDFKIRKGTFGN